MGTSGVDGIANFLAISDRLGTGGQPRPRQFSALADAGYSVVINLAIPHHGQARPDEDWLVTELGMQYVHLPIPWEAPEQVHLDRFLGYMELFDQDKVFVHCIKNMRVSVLVYVYRILRLDTPASVAERDMLRIWRPHGAWAELIGNALSDARLS